MGKRKCRVAFCNYLMIKKNNKSTCPLGLCGKIFKKNQEKNQMNQAKKSGKRKKRKNLEEKRKIGRGKGTN